MARPLPKDVEEQIAGTARRAEVRSVAIWGFILGGIFGFAIGATMFSAGGGSIYFMLGAGVIAALWYLAAGRRKDKKK
ncbi:MAG: hypothetical protein HWE08_11995 [Alphaproteobacteria bacterium]|nr:hypothetical protein [Alphaproteobacteria bacterium]